MYHIPHYTFLELSRDYITILTYPSLEKCYLAKMPKNVGMVVGHESDGDQIISF